MRALVFAQRLKDLAVLRRVRDRIDREYAAPLDVEALARGVNMAAAQLSRQFRLAFGTSPHTYLTARRVERAMTILHRTDRTDLGVDEVRGMVGWTTPETFGTRFAEVVGVAPDACGGEAGRHGTATAAAGPVQTAAVAGDAAAAPAAASPTAPSSVAGQRTTPVRNKEAPAGEPQLA
ncbi:AraC family transcriptional regulator [Streptomyces sp. PLK6-54]|uniref:AraC family transcriptional regulator n=2 Tax=Actinacidiphila acidipaludis TaxID=2873382 RepID=A0ABS7QHV1_9ACTN|nr:AraC family transcriptional regulator [Streptomyces acidipaludis]